MKVGIISADPRKVCWKTYFYHGIWRRCRVSCEPGPWWTPPLKPWYPPPTMDYEADVLPPDNPGNPMICFSCNRVAAEYISGGLFIVRDASGGSSSCGYRFSSVFRAYDALHIRASVPYWYFGTSLARPTGEVRFLVDGIDRFYINVHREYTVESGVTGYLEFYWIYHVDKKISFSTNIALDVIRRSSSNVWDFYLNGVLVYSYSFSSLYMDRFAMASQWTGSEVGLDYFRVYCDKSADS